MATGNTNIDRLHWTGGFSHHPVWPREPDIEIIASIAKRHLTSELPTGLRDTSMKVGFFAEGAFNKLYHVVFEGHHTSYLLRAALPVEPFYKSESEVATIAYLRAHTDISVPRIFAWDSNRDNELTFEWIIMEKIEGVTLLSSWRQMPWSRKIDLTENIARVVKKLRDCSFDLIGGLYFNSPVVSRLSPPVTHSNPRRSSIDSESIERLSPEVEVSNTSVSNVLPPTPARISCSNSPEDGGKDCDNEDLHAIHTPTTSRDATALKLDNPLMSDPSISIRPKESGGNEGSEFCIDHAFDSIFFTESRLFLKANRGPYQSSLEWMTSEIQAQLEWIRNCPSEDHDGYGSDYEEDAPEMERLCHGFLEILPTVFEEEKEKFFLHHGDLNPSNILIDPETYEITGIVDWEMINVVPEWKACEYPDFLLYMDPTEEDEPPIPSYENENHVDVERRDRWDYRALRRHFDQTMMRILREDQLIDNTMRTKAKRDCHQYIEQITSMLDWSAEWLKVYKATGMSRNNADWAKETCKDDTESDNGSDGGSNSDSEGHDGDD